MPERRRKPGRKYAEQIGEAPNIQMRDRQTVYHQGHADDAEFHAKNRRTFISRCTAGLRANQYW
jgi:lipopolysaccharide export system protein LptA